MKAIDLVSAPDPVVRSAATWLIARGLGHETFICSDGGYTTWQTARDGVFANQITRTVRPKHGGAR